MWQGWWIFVMVCIWLAGCASAPEPGPVFPIDLMQAERDRETFAYSGQQYFPLREADLLDTFWQDFLLDEFIPEAFKNKDDYWISLYREEPAICLTIQWRRRKVDTGFDLPLEGWACYSEDLVLQSWAMGRYSMYYLDRPEWRTTCFSGTKCTHHNRETE